VSARPTPTIVVVGSCMIDMTSYLPRLPGPGETLLGGSFALGFGGKGANQAVMARRLGARVILVGCVGSDVFGELTLAHLKEERLDLGWLARTDATSTGVAPIWVEPDGTNRIACVPGANDLVSPDRAATAIRQAAPDVVIGQFEIPQATTLAAFAAARAVGALTVLNPAPAAIVDPELLATTDWLIPNESEFAQLTSGGTTDDDALRQAAADLPPRLVVTLGRAGAALVQNETVHRVVAPEVEAVDTTGAGDAFVGAFAVGLALDQPATAAMALAVDCATASVRRRGTQSAMPSFDEAAGLLAAHARQPAD
jgi:ribokinase